MSNKKSKIEWTDRTWNPVTGCTKTSAGCAHCYAETMSARLQAMGLDKYRNGFRVTLHPEDIEEPKGWQKGRNVFVCSMGDLFHEEVPDGFIDGVMDTMRATPQHRYQVLTKRSGRMAAYFHAHEIPANAWLGVTVECRASLPRIEDLRTLPAAVRFLSCEPLVEDLGGIDLTGIDWVIVGGESGPQARPMKEEWATSIRRQAAASGTAFFFKQWGTWGSDGIKRDKKQNGKLLEGEAVQEMPTPKER